MIVIALATAMGCGTGRENDGSGEQAQATDTMALEEKYGIRITLVAVTAAGGLVDMRYKVIDAEKARAAFGEGPEPPAVIVEEDSFTLPKPQTVPEHLELEDGQTYYILYPNTGNAVRPGSLVTVKIGDVSVPHIVVR